MSMYKVVTGRVIGFGQRLDRDGGAVLAIWAQSPSGCSACLGRSGRSGQSSGGLRRGVHRSVIGPAGSPGVTVLGCCCDAQRYGVQGSGQHGQPAVTSSWVGMESWASAPPKAAPAAALVVFNPAPMLNT